VSNGGVKKNQFLLIRTNTLAGNLLL